MGSAPTPTVHTAGYDIEHVPFHATSMYSYVLFREGGVTKRVNARDENEINNTGFGVNRYRCVHTPVLNLVLEVRQY